MKFDADLNKRLSELQRGKQGVAPAPATDRSQPATVARAGGPRLTVGEAEEQRGPLEELLPGSVGVVNEGEYYEIITPVAAYGPWAMAATDDFEQTAQQNPFAGLEIIFFDTETTGLNNEPLFLVGMLCREASGEPYIRQLLARDYAEEPAVLAEARRLLSRAGMVVSYNGLTFDVPYLQNRLRYHKLGKFAPPQHLDLLPVARRRLGRALGNCKLQTLELHLCGRERCNDIAGADIPQAYHDYVADGEAGRLRRIIEHNSFDVITLAQLTAQLAETGAP